VSKTSSRDVSNTCENFKKEVPIMAEPSQSGKIPLTLQLPAEVAARLKMAAETQKRPAAELAVDLLDRYLPRVQQKGTIPYS
jgi:hypothetical protein